MVVQRCHAEDPLAARLERHHLYHHGKRFRDKDAAHQRKDEFLADGDGHGSQRRAERERADIAHENQRRVRVVPEKTQPRARNGRAEHRHFTDTGQHRLVQIARVVRAAGNVGKHRKAACDQHHRHDGEAVEAVGQVHRVARPGQDEIDEGEEEPAHLPRDVFEERHVERGFDRRGGAQVEPDAGKEGDEREQRVFVLGAQPLRVFENELAVVVNPADHAETEHDEQRNPGVFHPQIRPEEHGDADAQDDERAAHRRRTRFFQMRLRAVVAHVLPHLQAAQKRNHPPAKADGEEKRGQRAEDDARGEVGEGVERAEPVA